MSEGSSIPEMLGFPAVPFERESLYSVKSYQALYQLTEEEAKEVRDNSVRHSQVDLRLSQRYMNEPEYRNRVDKACEDITASVPTEEVKRIMARAQKPGAKPEAKPRKGVA